MTELLALPERANISTLILIDQVLIYAREKVRKAPARQGHLLDFFSI
jgi:hypothetical protein